MTSSAKSALIALVASLAMVGLLELGADLLVSSNSNVFDQYASYAQLRREYAPPMTLCQPQISFVTSPMYRNGPSLHASARATAPGTTMRLFTVG